MRNVVVSVLGLLWLMVSHLVQAQDLEADLRKFAGPWRELATEVKGERAPIKFAKGPKGLKEMPTVWHFQGDGILAIRVEGVIRSTAKYEVKKTPRHEAALVYKVESGPQKGLTSIATYSFKGDELHIHLHEMHVPGKLIPPAKLKDDSSKKTTQPKTPGAIVERVLPDTQTLILTRIKAEKRKDDSKKPTQPKA